MSGRRLLAIIIGIVGLLLLAVVVYFLVFQPGGEDAAQTVPEVPETGEGAVVDGTPIATATIPPTIAPGTNTVEVVVSLQTVPRGWQMTEAELTTDMRLETEVGTNVITDIEDAIGLYARQDIFQGETLTTDSLVRDPRLIGIENFGPSSLIPQGWVAMAVPIDRLSSVAYGLQPGDGVDVMLTFTLSAIDEEFQTLLNNSASFYLTPTDTGGEEGGTGEPTRPSIYVIDPYGRFETIPTGDIAHLGPSEDTARPIAVAVILQNARVVEVGTYQPPLPAAQPTPTVDPNQPTPTPGGPPPTPTPAPPDVILVALPPQQQLFLDYALEVTADIDFALRGENDGQLYTVQQVDLEYLLGQFGITIPPNFDYTIGGVGSTSLDAGDVQIEEQTEAAP